MENLSSEKKKIGILLCRYKNSKTSVWGRSMYCVCGISGAVEKMTKLQQT
jgi:hypothetical protein